MPNLKTHKKSSLKRTKKDYEKLHKWMDEGQKALGINHRFERHSGAYIEFVKDEFGGTEAVTEFLNHIIEDFQHTLKRVEKGIEKSKNKKCEKCGGWKEYPSKPLCLKCYNNQEETENLKPE